MVVTFQTSPQFQKIKMYIQRPCYMYFKLFWNRLNLQFPLFLQSDWGKNCDLMKSTFSAKKHSKYYFSKQPTSAVVYITFQELKHVANAKDHQAVLRKLLCLFRYNSYNSLRSRPDFALSDTKNNF